MGAILTAIFSQWRTLAIVGVVGFGAGCVVTNKWWEAKESAAQTRAELAAGRLEIEIAALRQNARDQNRRHVNETRKDAYRCRVPDDGNKLLNEARSGKSDR